MKLSDLSKEGQEAAALFDSAIAAGRWTLSEDLLPRVGVDELVKAGFAVRNDPEQGGGVQLTEVGVAAIRSFWEAATWPTDASPSGALDGTVPLGKGS
jgi:hypothetical protein